MHVTRGCPSHASLFLCVLLVPFTVHATRAWNWIKCKFVISCVSTQSLRHLSFLSSVSPPYYLGWAFSHPLPTLHCLSHQTAIAPRDVQMSERQSANSLGYSLTSTSTVSTTFQQRVQAVSPPCSRPLGTS